MTHVNSRPACFEDLRTHTTRQLAAVLPAWPLVLAELAASYATGGHVEVGVVHIDSVTVMRLEYGGCKHLTRLGEDTNDDSGCPHQLVESRREETAAATDREESCRKIAWRVTAQANVSLPGSGVVWNDTSVCAAGGLYLFAEMIDDTVINEVCRVDLRTLQEAAGLHLTRLHHSQCRYIDRPVGTTYASANMVAVADRWIWLFDSNRISGRAPVLVYDTLTAAWTESKQSVYLRHPTSYKFIAVGLRIYAFATAASPSEGCDWRDEYPERWYDTPTRGNSYVLDTYPYTQAVADPDRYRYPAPPSLCIEPGVITATTAITVADGCAALAVGGRLAPSSGKPTFDSVGPVLVWRRLTTPPNTQQYNANTEFVGVLAGGATHFEPARYHWSEWPGDTLSSMVFESGWGVAFRLATEPQSDVGHLCVYDVDDRSYARVQGSALGYNPIQLHILPPRIGRNA